MNRTHSISSPLPLPRIELYNLSPRVEFLPQKAIMGLRSPIKKRIRLSDIYWNHSGESYRMRIKSRYGFYPLRLVWGFEGERLQGFLRYPAILFQ